MTDETPWTNNLYSSVISFTSDYKNNAIAKYLVFLLL